MQINSTAILLSIVVVLMFASVYTSVALEEANAAKATKKKFITEKAKKGWLAQVAKKYR